VLQKACRWHCCRVEAGEILDDLEASVVDTNVLYTLRMTEAASEEMLSPCLRKSMQWPEKG
jgi:hypothetical protein